MKPQRIKADRRKAARGKKPVPIDWIKEQTGLPTGAWIAVIQSYIRHCSGPARTRGKYKGHSSTDVLRWINLLAARIRREVRITTIKARDENMAMAAAMGMALVAWYVRVHRAKAFDPRRPLKLRKMALIQANDYVAAICRAMHDDGWDPACFPDQEWENPWHPKARDGKFV